MLPLGLDFPWKRMWRRGGGVRLRGGSMRWRELLECVEAEPGITPDAIATRMGVSTRSIRSFAREANERLGRAASLAKRRGGILPRDRR